MLITIYFLSYINTWMPAFLNFKNRHVTIVIVVGPRIIEDPNVSDDQRGIPQSETRLRPQLRVIFALDNPGRHFPLRVGKMPETRISFVTETPVHLWDVQATLLSPNFYGSGSISDWAINVAGVGPSGLIRRGEWTRSQLPEAIPLG